MDMPGGEKQQAFRERAAAAVGDIVARHAGERIIIVSHGGILGEYLAHGLGLDVTRRHPFRFDNASISEVEAGSSLMRIHHLNDVAHLLGTLARAHPSDDSPMGDGQLDEDRHADDDAGV